MAQTRIDTQGDLRPKGMRDETRGAGETPAPAIGDPAPLGLAAFALTTFVLSCANAGLLKEAGAFIPLAFFYGGATQFAAGMWEFRNKNTFGATAFSSYGGFWIALGFFFMFGAQLGVATSAQAIGATLLAWTIFTIYMWVASYRTTGAVFLVFSLLLLTFILLTWGALGKSTTATHIGGWLGILTALAAWYASAAGVINSTFGRALLPVFARA